MKCIRGLVNQGHLDPECPNANEHGPGKYSIGARELIQRFHDLLLRDRTEGFEQLHICGRTGYLLKASLLSHGYTVVIKEQNLQAESLLTVAYALCRARRFLFALVTSNPEIGRAHV